MTYKEITKKSFKAVEFLPHEVISGTYINCDFSGANLSETTIKAKFVNCDFRHAKFNAAYIYGAHFINGELAGASFQLASFDAALFDNCYLGNTDFQSTSGMRTCSFMGNCNGWYTCKGVSFSRHNNDRFLTVVSLWNGSDPRTTRKDFESKVPTASGSAFVEPHPIPPVNHYRSAPRKVTKRQLDEAETYGHLDDSKYNHTKTQYKMHQWGYGECAVLECSDIEIYRKYHD